MIKDLKDFLAVLTFVALAVFFLWSPVIFQNFVN